MVRRACSGCCWPQQAAVADAHALVDALHVDVLAFAAGTEAADDLTILALRWQAGPEAGSRR